jgi:hypothetical protein
LAAPVVRDLDESAEQLRVLVRLANIAGRADSRRVQRITPIFAAQQELHNRVVRLKEVEPRKDYLRWGSQLNRLERSNDPSSPDTEETGGLGLSIEELRHSYDAQRNRREEWERKINRHKDELLITSQSLVKELARLQDYLADRIR